MRRSVVPIVVLVSIALAACGGSGSATPSNAGGGGGQATGTVAPTGATATAAPTGATGTVAPTAATGGGGGDKPAGWDQYGRVHIDMSGPVSKSIDLGFVPAGSIFGGGLGSSLNFTIEDTNEVVSILVSADGSVLVSYGGPDFSMPGTQCMTSNWSVAATSGSGSFDCTASLTIMASGAVLQGGKLSGTFDAHA